MSTKGKRPMRALTAGDKIEAIQRVNDGESKASVARDIGVPESTLRGWCKNEDKLRYMSSRLSSPETDKSSDAEPSEKRARTESPPAPAPTVAPAAAPVELTTRRAEPVELTTRRAEPGASVSMSAISPLSGLASQLAAGSAPLAHSHLGLSFNEIATNLSLLAQLSPGLSASASRALRSVRSPKPAAPLNLADKHRPPKHHDPYSSRKCKDPVDETLWYWLKTQQAMFDLSAQTAAAQPLPIPKPDPALTAKLTTPAAPINAHLDYNRNTWMWQYYKQFGGAIPPPEDKHKSASQVPKEKSSENILYSQLVKGKCAEEAPREDSKESKARTVLDSLLLESGAGAGRGEVRGEAGAALEHGDKFLAWLEASGDPSVTRMHLHQLRALLHNLRARHAPPPAQPAAAAVHAHAAPAHAHAH